MKNKPAVLMLVLLLAVGVLVIYHEATASIVVSCTHCAVCCASYEGTFEYGNCWYWQGIKYCDFECYNFLFPDGHNPPCDWFDPTIGMCQFDE